MMEPNNNINQTKKEFEFIAVQEQLQPVHNASIKIIYESNNDNDMTIDDDDVVSTVSKDNDENGENSDDEGPYNTNSISSNDDLVPTVSENNEIDGEDTDNDERPINTNRPAINDCIKIEESDDDDDIDINRIEPIVIENNGENNDKDARPKHNRLSNDDLDYDVLRFNPVEMERVIDEERKLKLGRYLYKCRKCKVSYRRRVDIWRHQTFHHYKRAPPFPCLACKVVLLNERKLKEHWHKQHSTVLRCKLCGTICRSKCLIKRHLIQCYKARQETKNGEETTGSASGERVTACWRRPSEECTEDAREPNYGSEESEEDEECWPICTPRRQLLSVNASHECHTELKDSILKSLLTHKRREDFTQIDCGPVLQYQTPYEAFVAIWNRDIMELIVRETNNYAHELNEEEFKTGAMNHQYWMCHWKETNIDELYLHFAFIIATGIVIKSDIADYWKLDMFETESLGNIISEYRYKYINKYLHFNSDPINMDDMSRSEAKLWKIQPVIDHLNERFKSVYVPQQDLVLDNCLTEFDCADSDIKSIEVCESPSGYIWQFIIHTKQLTGNIKSISELVQGLNDKGYTIWLDSSYQCQDIASYLVSKSFDCVGILKSDRDLSSQDMILWKDEYGAYLMSTFKGIGAFNKDGVSMPLLVDDYNIHMKNLDKKHQLLAPNPIEKRRTKVWYKKLFKRLLNASVVNAYILYDASQNCDNSITNEEFRKKLVFQIVEKHTVLKYGDISSLSSAHKLPPEITGHFPREYGDKVGRRGEKIQGNCRLCTHYTSCYCPACNVALCPFTCHIKFHSAS